ncbi:hypothetical protein ACFXPW_05345 [Streptomyces goshikiensis]|uniref:hypothetical protein n=1 Tax=Streptomyces goshikiensis TaxID=1942 RepID=UPI0036957B09
MTRPLFRQSVCAVQPWTVPAAQESPEQPYVAERAEAVRRMVRALRPGGRLPRGAAARR